MIVKLYMWWLMRSLKREQEREKRRKAKEAKR